jgi:periplasmic protein CpxP/Spy
MRLACATLTALAALSTSALAQSNPTTSSPMRPMANPGAPGPSATDSTAGSSNPAVTVKPEGSPESTGAVEPGANSFTEGQARSRIEAQGFGNVVELRKDEQGIWRGRATQNGRSVNVMLDYGGNVATQPVQ